MRRNWLRPKWYVTDVGGGWVGGSAYRDSMQRVPADEPIPPCDMCQRDLTDASGFYSHPGWARCIPCQEAHRAAQPPPSKRRKVVASIKRQTIWRIPTDRIYWWWCERFGKRIYD